MTRPPLCRPFPSRPLTVSSLLVVAMLWALSANTSINFQRYFGGLPPAAAATIACALGIASLFVLQKRFGFCVIGTDTVTRGSLTAAAAALPFMAAVTSVDLLLGFPADIHVELPAALVFYPLMGLIAQLALHIAPFTLLLWAFSQMFGAWPLRRRIWLAIILSASVESAFQLSGSAGPGDGSALLSAFVATHLLAFGLTELYLFCRFDFVTMVIFRLTYYGYWHIFWGNLIQSSS